MASTEFLQFTGDEMISDILLALPEATEILSSHGLACVSCHINVFETLTEGIQTHGMTDADLTQILDELNDACIDLQIPNKVMTGGMPELTDSARDQVQKLQKEEQMTGWGFKIEVLPTEGDEVTYFLDFLERTDPGDRIIPTNGIKLFLSPDSLAYLQGCVIDFSAEAGGFQIKKVSNS